MDSKTKDAAAGSVTKSILQNEDADPSGRYTLDGRILQVSRAVNKNEANRLTQEGVDNRFKRDTDKRRLYLLSSAPPVRFQWQIRQSSASFAPQCHLWIPFYPWLESLVLGSQWRGR